MRNDLKEKKIHGSPLFRFQYYPKPEGCTQLLVPCHWHEEVEILVVEKGRLTVIIDGKHLTSSEGEVFFVNSGQLHQMQGSGSGNVFYSFVFSMRALDFKENDYAQTALLAPLGEKWCFPERILPLHPCSYPLMNIMAELKRLVEERPIGTVPAHRPAQTAPGFRTEGNADAGAFLYGAAFKNRTAVCGGSLHGKYFPGTGGGSYAYVPQIFLKLFFRYPSYHPVPQPVPGGTGVHSAPDNSPVGNGNRTCVRLFKFQLFHPQV